MHNFEDIMFVAEDIYSYFSKLSREDARNSYEQWDISEAHSQSGALALCLENISRNIEDYSAEELSKMIYSISKAQREIFKLI